MKEKVPLRIYVHWHKEFKWGESFAERIYSTLNRNSLHPEQPGMAIPVFYRYEIISGLIQPEIPLEKAATNIMLILVEENIMLDEDWLRYLNELYEIFKKGENKIIIYPVALKNTSFSILSKISNLNFLRIYDPQDSPDSINETLFELYATRLIGKLSQEIGRILLKRPRTAGQDKTDFPEEGAVHSPAPLTLFISHSKRDGRILAEKLRDYAQSKCFVKAYYDVNDITPGFEFSSELKQAVDEGTAAMVAIKTDSYSSREWCISELLWAKTVKSFENGVLWKMQPLVVVDAVEKGEKRALPYIGNVPTVRWNEKNLQPIIDKAMLEVISSEHAFQHFRNRGNYYALPQPYRFINCPPEIISLMEMLKDLPKDKETIIFHTDPPLGFSEQNMLKNKFGNIIFLTPSICPQVAEGDKVTDVTRQFPLSGMKLQVSISNNPDWGQYGVGKIHQEAAMVDIARSLLVNGAKLAYGGDLRKGGFTYKLVELVQAYTQIPSWDSFINDFHDPVEIRRKLIERLHFYLGKPIWSTMNKEDEVELAAISTVHKIDAGEFPEPGNENDNSYYYYKASCFTRMRETMAQEVDASILMGGDYYLHSGRMPGIVEEALLALKSNKPVYLIGGFGGCTRLLIEAKQNKNWPEKLSYARQIEYNPQKQTLALVYNTQHGEDALKNEYSQIEQYITGLDISDLKNGLNREENHELFYTDDIQVIISLLLKGLKKIGNI